MAGLVKTDKLVTFGRGIKADYDASIVDIYFATDEQVIYMEGIAYDAKANTQIQDAIAGILGGGEGKYLTNVELDANGNLVGIWSDFGTTFEQVTEVPEGATVVPVDSLEEAKTVDADYVSITTGEEPNQVTTYYKKDDVNVADKLAELSNAVDELKVKNVSSEDKVLSNTDGEITAQINLVYDETSKLIKLTGKGDEVIGSVDSTLFVKDGMLDKAEVIDIIEKDGKFVYGEDDTEADVTAAGKYIHLAFNLDADKSDVYLSVTEILSAYTAGKDVEIKEDNTINVSLDEDITLLGTTWGQYGSGHTIKAGTSLSEILKEFLIKVIDVKVVNPTLSISAAKTPSKTTYEVGDEVTITLSSTYTDGKFTGTVTDGYVSGTGNGTNYTNQPAGCSAPDAEYYKNDEKLDSNEDLINVTAAGVTYNAKTTYDASINTPIRNNGTESEKSIDGAEVVSSDVIVKGYYKYYIGFNNWLNADTKTSDDIKTLLDKSDFLTSASVTPFSGAMSTGNGNSIVIAYPSTYSILSIDSEIGASILSTFDYYTVQYTNGNSTVDYTVAILPNLSIDSISFKNLVIGK